MKKNLCKTRGGDALVAKIVWLPKLFNRSPKATRRRFHPFAEVTKNYLNPVRQIFLAIVLGFFGLLSGLAPAAAQETRLTIQPGHSTIIRDYVTTEHLQPTQVKMHFELGSVVPEEIRTEPVPLGMVAKVPEVRNYEYFAADGGRIVFVEPYTRRVVQIVQ